MTDDPKPVFPRLWWSDYDYRPIPLREGGTDGAYHNEMGDRYEVDPATGRAWRAKK